MKNKMIAGIMCAFMMAVSAIPVYAAEPAATENFEVVSVVMLSDGVSRASWGQGELYCSDPLFSKPQGYAKTVTFAGTAYKVSAQISVKDSNGDTYSSTVKTETNASEAVSATITSKTSKCTFTGYHRMQQFLVIFMKKTERLYASSVFL